MPIHDWTMIPDGIGYHFRHCWISALGDILNHGSLAHDYYALIEAEAAPKRRQKSIVVRHVSDDSIVAMVELVSPGNDALREFVVKSAALVRAGVHLLVVDLHPRTARDPCGIHPLIWNELTERETTLPDDRPLTAISYEAGSPLRAHIQPLGVGLPLPTMPLYLRPGFAVPVPLEATYQTSLAAFPARWRTVLEGTSE